MIGRFQGNIVYIMVKIYGVIVSTMIMFGNIVVKGIREGVVFESTGFNPQEKLSDSGGFQGFGGEFIPFRFWFVGERGLFWLYSGYWFSGSG